ncbi:T9SS type A sorting domain-containing protein, partial [Ignavibacterium album]
TVINYSIPEASYVELKVYDILGNEVANLVSEEKTPGNYNAVYDASLFASGVYIYTLKTNNFFQTKKMMLIK